MGTKLIKYVFMFHAQALSIKNAMTFPFPVSSLFLGIISFVSGTLLVQKSSLFLLYDRTQALCINAISTFSVKLCPEDKF